MHTRTYLCQTRRQPDTLSVSPAICLIRSLPHPVCATHRLCLTRSLGLQFSDGLGLCLTRFLLQPVFTVTALQRSCSTRQIECQSIALVEAESLRGTDSSRPCLVEPGSRRGRVLARPLPGRGRSLADAGVCRGRVSARPVLVEGVSVVPNLGEAGSGGNWVRTVLKKLSIFLIPSKLQKM